MLTKMVKIGTNKFLMPLRIRNKAYRSTKQAAIGQTRHLLLYGNEMKLTTEDDLSTKMEVNEETQVELAKLIEKLKQIRKPAVH